ncbi:MAG: hypothetical protein EPO67_16415 [Reyranella sp.]|jgi:hypothetical protein|nr:MAG: hypothetical protein EPO67_16415 [Reyranella sp.]
MKPQEALYVLENLSGIYVAQIYRDMPREQLVALVKECERPTPDEVSEKALQRWAREPFRRPGQVDPKGKKEEPVVEAPLPIETAEPETAVTRAIAKEGRLSTPARRRAAFRHHFARCRSVVAAAARTGVDSRTVRRWRKAFPKFAADLDAIVAERRREAIENVVLAAGHVEIRPIFYRGRRLGHHTRRDRTLDLYLLKQADAEARRAERQQAEDFEARVSAEVARRLSEMSAFDGHRAAPAHEEFDCVSNEFVPAPRDIALAR